MRALPMWQPWASLVVAGVKQIETRPGPPPRTIRGQRIAIHATATPEHLGKVAEWPFIEHDLDPATLPLGAIIGSVVVGRHWRLPPGWGALFLEQNPYEWALGDYGAGRYAWLLGDPRPLAEPVPWKGKQGIMVIPDEVIGCTCEVRGPDYDDTTTDEHCAFHGKDGSMVVRAPGRPLP